MGYLSFDASVKIHYSGRFTSTKTDRTGYGGVNGYIRHIDRGTDRRNGCEVQHSNPDIQSDYTLENESYYRDDNGEWQETAHSGDMLRAVGRRLEYAREHGARISTKGQNDTVIVRPLVVQLDRETVTEHEDIWKWDVIEILEEQFGKENITGFSVHKDETNIHIHVAFVPCYETQKRNGEMKCTLSQTKFFKNPKQLAGIHQKIRKCLLDKGYDVELENKPIDEVLAGYTDRNGNFHQQGLTPEQLKELSVEKISLKLEAIKMSISRNELTKLEMAVAEMMKTSKAEQEKIEKEREALSAQKTALDNDKATVQAESQAVAVEKANVQRMKEEAENMLEKAYSTAEICNQIISEEKKLNAKFMEFLDDEGRRMNKKIREYVEYWFNRFQKARRDSYSDWQSEMWRIRNERLRLKSPDTDNSPDIIDMDDTDTGYSFSL